MTDHVDVCLQLLREGRYVALATASPDGNPWASPVHYTLTSDLVFIFISAKSSRHSANIRHSGRASWTVFWGEKPPPQTDGMIFSGSARELSGAEAVKYASIYYSLRADTRPPHERSPFDVDCLESTDRAFYILTPDEAFKLDKDDAAGVSRLRVDIPTLVNRGVTQVRHPLFGCALASAARSHMTM